MRRLAQDKRFVTPVQYQIGMHGVQATRDGEFQRATGSPCATQSLKPPI